jgi:hypothetical protein
MWEGFSCLDTFPQCEDQLYTLVLGLRPSLNALQNLLAFADAFIHTHPASNPFEGMRLEGQTPQTMFLAPFIMASPVEGTLTPPSTPSVVSGPVEQSAPASMEDSLVSTSMVHTPRQKMPKSPSTPGWCSPYPHVTVLLASQRTSCWLKLCILSNHGLSLIIYKNSPSYLTSPRHMPLARMGEIVRWTYICSFICICFSLLSFHWSQNIRNYSVALLWRLKHYSSQKIMSCKLSK